MRISGQCHCGNLKYSVDPQKLFEFLCHCTGCRKLNGGGHLSGIMYAKDSLELEGEFKHYAYQGGSGKNIETCFCPTCATTVLAYPHSHPEGVVIRANTLDDPSQFEPKTSLFPEKAFAWDTSVISEAQS